MKKFQQVAVIGDAGRFADAEKIALAEQTGMLLADNGFIVLTGGMGGVMAAAGRGAQSAENKPPVATIGVLPGADDNSGNEWLDIVLPTNLDHGRNQIVALADAVIVIGGGAGTLSEICFAWLHHRLIIALQCDGWSGQLAGKPLDNKRDDVIYAAATAEEAVAILKSRLSSYPLRSGRIAADTDGV